MKTKFVTFLFLTFSFISLSQSNFYYYFSEKIYLDPVSNKFTVEFKDNTDESIFVTNNISYNQIKDKVYEVSGNYLDILNASNGEYNVNQLYKYENNNAYILNEISLRYNDNVTQTQIQSLESTYQLVKIIDDPQLKVYKVSNPLVVANEIYETGLVKYCQPNFIMNFEYFGNPNDEYFQYQYYLHNTGQLVNGNTGTVDADIDAPEAWDITLGDPNIVIAVIDEGVSPDHIDLPASRIDIRTGSNFHDGSGSSANEPFPHNDGNHGNAIAGIIAATGNNNIGITGIAPNCKIMPIKIDIVAVPTLSQGLYFATNNQADIISCSWGISSPNPLPSSPITDAIELALLYNIPVVFAAGNTANHTINDNGYVAYPANLNEDDFPVSYPEIDLISVGASNRNDLQSNYSPSHLDLDICAPSHSDYYVNNQNEGIDIWTIDIPGEGGYNFWHDMEGTTFDYLNGQYLPTSNMGANYKDFTGHMGGTSASAPQVAGVIALMKSVNSCLTVPQINEILKNSTDKVGGYDYNWLSSKPGHSNELGYGRLNAFNAVSLAQNYYNSNIDLYVKDRIEDVGVEPNNNPIPNPSIPSISDFQFDTESRHALWVFDSPDIWVRNQQDGMTVQNSEEIEYFPGDPAYVYVKVRTKGCLNSLGTEELELYWSKSATIQSFPDYWNGSITNPVLMGDFIGVKTITSILNSPFIPYQILEFEWFPPNPDDYSGIVSQPWGFSFLTRIISNDDPISVPANQAGNISGYVALNNNIASKNITVIDAGKPFSDQLTNGNSIVINNPENETKSYDLIFRNSKPIEEKSILKESEVLITLDENLWNKWEESGFENENIIICDEINHIILVDNENFGSIKNIVLNAHEMNFLSVKINFLTKEVSNRELYDLYIVQKESVTQEVVGGFKVLIKKSPRPMFVANAGEDMEVSKNETITLNSEDINEDAIYNWYDENGNLVYTGIEFLLVPEVTSKYKLEIIAESDGYKDYDEVEVNIKLPKINSITPNPVNQSNNISINYNSENADSLYIVLIPLNGSFNDYFTLNINDSQKEISTNSYPPGLYFLSLVADEQIVDQKTIIVN